MCACAAYHHRSFARSEQSLRRSFSAIHHPFETSFHDIHTSNRSSYDGNGINQNDLIYKSPSPTGVVDHHPSLDGMPKLPFHNRPQRGPPSPRGPPKKLQRRHSAFTATMAQELVTKLANEKQYERQYARARRSSAPLRAFTPPLTYTIDEGQAFEIHDHKGLRNDYTLGEAIRCPSHMIVEHTPKQATQAANSLSKHDFAFIKRSDGSYSYAILAYRSLEPVKGTHHHHNCMEECMTFVMTDYGSTKKIRKSHWGEFIRLVRVTSFEFEQHYFKDRRVPMPPKVSPVLCQEIEEPQDDWVPNMITFAPQVDDECSLISSVSDRACHMRCQCNRGF